MRAATGSDAANGEDLSGDRRLELQASASGEGSYLVAQFREFYFRVQSLKQRVERGTWPSAEGSGEGAEAVPAPDAAAPAEEGAAKREEASPSGAMAGAVWQELVTLLERQAMVAGRTAGRLGSEVYDQARYVMAALGDEIFLHATAWGGSETWTANLLEAKVFGSHRAGERIFERIDAMLASRDAFHVDLARVYLLALALGFQGKYRGKEEGPAAIAAYRKQLYVLITRREPRVVRQEEKMFPAAYGSTLDQAAAQRLPYLRPWAWALVLLLAAWVLVSVPLWQRLTEPLEPYLESILGS